MVRDGTIPMLALFLVACEPQEHGTEQTTPVGHLELEGGVNEIYRDDHRIEIVSVSDPNQSPSCGMLTERAYQDLKATIESLDPSVDYDFETSEQECSYFDSPGAQIHIEGFEHSPFSCDAFCCRPELSMIPIVYLHASNNLIGTVLEVDGEPYVAIESEIPCR